MVYMSTNPTTKSLLTKKDRNLHWRAQVKKLHTIANRAQHKADHLNSLARQYATNQPDWAEDARKGAVTAQAKAKAAAEEMLAIAKANGDERARGL